MQRLEGRLQIRRQRMLHVCLLVDLHFDVLQEPSSAHACAIVLDRDCFQLERRDTHSIISNRRAPTNLSDVDLIELEDIF